MRFRKTASTVLCPSVQDSLSRELISFANSCNGTIYIGVSDSGNILGVENAEDCILRLSQLSQQTIKPDLSPLLHCETWDCGGKAIVAVQIRRGTDRPYYLSRSGLCPDGVFLRQNDTSVPASPSAIRQMILETDGDSFENRRSLEQNLTFETAKAEFELRKTAFGLPQMQSLHLLSADGLYSNLALLLSDQCPRTIKIAVFDSVSSDFCTEEQQFGGSLLRQLGEVCDYIDSRSQAAADTPNFPYSSSRNHPETAVREALLNAILHRNYDSPADTLIRIYPDRMEFVTPGGLFDGLDTDDLRMGLSVCRNPRLSGVFHRLQLARICGTGIHRITSAYAGLSVSPRFEATSNVCRVVLPSRENAVKIVSPVPPREVRETVVSSTPTPVEEQIMQFVEQNASITRKQVQELFGMSQSPANRVLKKLVDSGLLLQVGGSRCIRYEKP